MSLNIESVKNVPAVSVTYAQSGRSTRSNELGMRPMQERAYERRGEQYLLIKSPPASGKSRALMFIALYPSGKHPLTRPAFAGLVLLRCFLLFCGLPVVRQQFMNPVIWLGG